MTTTPASSASSQQANIDAALLVLKSMGLSLDDLTGASSNRPPVPTFAEYVPVVSATLTPATLRAYGSYWKRVICQWGGRHLDEPTPSEIKQLAAYVKANAVQRRNSRGGHNAAENLISALRCPYRRAVDDGLIDEKDNPARKVPKPRRLPSTRRALADARLAEINQVAATTGGSFTSTSASRPVRRGRQLRRHALMDECYSRLANTWRGVPVGDLLPGSPKPFGRKAFSACDSAWEALRIGAPVRLY